MTDTAKAEFGYQKFEYTVLATVDGMQRCKLQVDGRSDADAFFVGNPKVIRIDRTEFVQRVPDPGMGVTRVEVLKP